MVEVEVPAPVSEVVVEVMLAGVVSVVGAGLSEKVGNVALLDSSGVVELEPANK